MVVFLFVFMFFVTMILFIFLANSAAELPLI